MRITATAVSLSWIPSESVWGGLRPGFELGLAHWDDPLPDSLSGVDEVHEMCREDRFRFGNVLTAWAEVEDGAIVDAGVGEESDVVMGATTVRVARVGATFRAVALPVLRDGPEHIEGAVTFRQTVGGRTGVPIPRPVPHAPFVQWQAPTVWTTLALTLHADGRSTVELVGASAFPRHWVYDTSGNLAFKSGLADQDTWVNHSFGVRTPWRQHDQPALVVAAESALERQMSEQIMRGGRKPDLRRAPAGTELTTQGAPGNELLLVLDGVVGVAVDGEPLAEVGPGAVLGERALLEGGLRTATLTAVTPVRVAVARAEHVDMGRLRALAATHRREHVVDSVPR